MELSSAIREDYCHCPDTEKDRREREEEQSNSKRDSHKRATESLQKKKGLVDRRQIKRVKECKAKDIFNVWMSFRHLECLTSKR